MKNPFNLKNIFSGTRLSAYIFIVSHIKERLRLYFGIGVNLLYIAWNTAFAVIYGDALLYATSFYYFFLVLVRYVILRSRNTDTAEIPEGRSTLLVGILLLPSAFSMSAVMLWTLVRGLHRRYSPLTVIPQSLFLLYCLIGALIRISHHKEKRARTSLALDIVSLCAAFFSVFNLVNYLSHTAIAAFDYSLALIVGLLAAATSLSAAVVLIIKSLKVLKSQ